jgi:hypothetical protein
MYVCMYVCMCVCVYVCMCMNVCMYVLCMYNVCMNVCVCMYILCMHACMYYVCMYVCVCMYMYYVSMYVLCIMYYVCMYPFLTITTINTVIPLSSSNRHVFITDTQSFLCDVWTALVGAFAKLRKATSCPSVRLSARNSSATTGRIFMKFDIWVF